MFKCGFCGKEYPTIDERMECERRCKANELKKQADAKRIEEENRRKADYKEMEELAKQKNEIQKKIDELAKRTGYYYCIPSTISILDSLFGR